MISDECGTTVDAESSLDQQALIEHFFAALTKVLVFTRPIIEATPTRKAPRPTRTPRKPAPKRSRIRNPTPRIRRRAKKTARSVVFLGCSQRCCRFCFARLDDQEKLTVLVVNFDLILFMKPYGGKSSVRELVSAIMPVANEKRLGQNLVGGFR